jgi:hypothetical protein
VHGLPTGVGLVLKLGAALALIVATAGVARADRVVAVVPLSTLGAEDKSAQTKKVVAAIETAITALPGNKIIAAAKVTEAIDKAKKPALKACEGDPACLTELGRLVGAQVIVSGEVGGLGDSKVIYLQATDVTTGKELRSTTLTIGPKDDGGGATGAAIRLLDPDKYRGTLHLAIDVSGATVFVNGSKIALTDKSELALPVGTQAIRVTHPQYHDFIKFIDVPYGKTQDVPVPMTQYPIVEHDVKAKPTNRDTIEYVDPPLYRRWYVAGPAIVVVATGLGILAAALAHHFPAYDTCRKLNAPSC